MGMAMELAEIWAESRAIDTRNSGAKGCRADVFAVDGVVFGAPEDELFVERR